MAVAVDLERPEHPRESAHRALSYLQDRIASRRVCAVVTGSDPFTRNELLTTLSTRGRRVGGEHWATVPAPTDSPSAFDEVILGQLGFELLQEGALAAQSLLTVFLRHEGACGRRLVVVVDPVEEFGPRVLSHLEDFLRVQSKGVCASTLVLAGGPDLNRVLDSPGMSRLSAATRERFDLDRAAPWRAPALLPASAQEGPVTHRLEVLLDGRTVGRAGFERGRLLIGRSRQCELRLGGSLVSRHHALVMVAGGVAFIVDLRSTNGTQVNGEPIHQRALRPGDLVTVGNFQLRYDQRG